MQMTTMILDGKQCARGYEDEIKNEIAGLEGRAPQLTVFLVGNDPASSVYVNRKKKTSEQVGITSELVHLPTETTESELLDRITRCNNDPACDGILVQLPLPPHISAEKVIHTIAPEKDVDGFHPINLGKLLGGEQGGMIPCTPLGVKKLLEYYEIDPKGKHTVIVGRSNIVGKPLAALLMQKAEGCNATVTVAHSASERLQEICQSADILISSIGIPGFITADYVKPGAVVIDVGINRVDDPSLSKGYRLVGDVNFDQVAPISSAITPVPGGVGPMTIAMLLQNTLQSYKNRSS